MAKCSENRLVFCESVLPLQRISAFQTAMELWSRKIQNEFCNSMSRETGILNFRKLKIRCTNDEGVDKVIEFCIPQESYDLFLKDNAHIPIVEMKDTIEALRVPGQIKKIIIYYVFKIFTAIKNWMRDHLELTTFTKLKAFDCLGENGDIFFDSYTFSIFEVITSECLKLMVWRSDATIDYEKTAFLLVKFGSIEQSAKLDLSCMYFMRGELKENPQLQCKIPGKRRLMPTQEPSFHGILAKYVRSIRAAKRVHNSSIVKRCELDMVTHPHYRNNFVGVESVLDRLNRNDRLNYITRSVVIHAMGRHEDCIGLNVSRFGEFVKSVISHCDEHEQYALFTAPNFIRNLMKILASVEDDMENAVKTWLHVRGLIGDNQRIDILRMIGMMRESETGHIHELLVKLWRSSPLSMKEFVYEQFEDNDFLYVFCIRPMYLLPNLCDGSDFKRKLRHDGILIEILIDADPEFRKQLWRRYWTEIVDRSQLSSLKTIMGLCLLRNEMGKFKNEILSSSTFQEYFGQLITTGKCAAMNEYLEVFFGGDEPRLVEAKKVIFEGIAGPGSIIRIMALSEENARAFCDFLSDVFSDDVDGLVEFKMNAISGYFNSRILSDGLNNEIKDLLIAAERLCDEPTLAEVKKKIIQICNSMSFNPNATHNLQGPTFIFMYKWCLGYADVVDELRRCMRKRKLGK